MITIKIIAEAGVNFKDMEEAFKFIDKSKELGLFATKFQLFDENNIKDAPKEYHDFLKSIMLDYDKAKELFDYGRSIGQEVFFSVMYPKAIDICEQVGVRYYKIRFKDNLNWNILNKVYGTGKPFFISANQNIAQYHVDRCKTLFCIPKYPASYEDYKTATNLYYRNFGFKGVSDHTPDLELFLKHSEGYEYWEKHVCLTKDCLESKWSCTFEELKEVFKG